MTSKNPTDKWSQADAYEPYVGRWSRLVAAEFIKWLAQPNNLNWLDVGCGTGALSQTILNHAAPKSVTGVDRSEAYASYTHSKLNSVTQFGVSDARKLPFVSASFDVVVSGLVLNFLPEPLDSIKEQNRVVKKGGVVAAYVWDYAGEMQLMRHFWNAAVALNPDAQGLDEGIRFPMCNPAPLQQLFEVAGLDAVETRTIDVPTYFRDFDDYWTPFLGGQGPAPSYVASLNEEQRAELREKIRTQLPFQSDGSISLIARAWAVKGTRR